MFSSGNLTFFWKTFLLELVFLCSYVRQAATCVRLRDSGRNFYKYEGIKAFLKFSEVFNSLNFQRQPHKMIKHTQTTRWQQLTICFSLFDHFVGLVLK